MGPVGEASGLGPLRVTLPMEVVTVSMYVMPIASSLMIQLELMLEIPGVTTSPMDMEMMGASTSMGSGICKQAITPAKPHSGMGGHTSANACAGKEDLGEEGAFGGVAGDHTGIIWENWQDLPPHS